MDIEIISSKIKEAGCDIYYVDDFSITLPHSFLLNGKLYFRFCEFIFIPDSTESLSPDQVIIVNQIRAVYFKTHPQFHVNIIVKELFKSMIEVLNPTTVLEFGPGFNPLTPSADNGNNFYFVDFNPTSIEFLKSLGLNSNLFGKESMLSIPNESIDVIISIFVFQFDISQTQVNELYRVLNMNGLLLANMYKRSEESRIELIDKFSSTGFLHSIVSDRSNLCLNHEYWVLYKTKNEEKINTLIKHINKKAINLGTDI